MSSSLLPCPLVNHLDTHPSHPALAIERAPSETEAATFLATLDLSSGRPTASWAEVDAFTQACPFWVRALMLPNQGETGHLALLFREPRNPARGIAVLLARGPALGGDHPFFRITPAHPDQPFVFSPQVYRLLEPNTGTFAHAHGALDWRDAPGPDAGDRYTALAHSAQAALTVADGWGPVVAPFQARPGALIAPWSLQSQPPEGCADILAGGAWALGEPTYGTMGVYGGCMDDAGLITPRPFPITHQTTARTKRALPRNTAWLHARLTDAGCPWAPHQWVAQSHPYAGHQSQMAIASTRRPALLVEVDISAFKARANTHHGQIHHAACRQRAMAW